MGFTSEHFTSEQQLHNEVNRNRLYEQETNRLFDLLANAGYQYEDCSTIAPLTSKINRFKEEQNALILAHHYMTPDITFGIADYAEDALGLIRRAEESSADTIVMCSVASLAECVKISCPDKKVLCPEKLAGCSVSDSITVDDVYRLKEKYPGVPTIAYVTTSAAVKAVSDYIVTSANVRDLIQALPDKQVIFYPDHSISSSLNAEFSDKEIIGWNGTCVVHDNYSVDQVMHFRQQHPDAHVLFHSEVNPDLYLHGELHGGTKAMLEYVDKHPEVNSFFMVTECGLSDQLRTKYPEKKFIGTCSLCPFMKMISLDNTLLSLDEKNSWKYEINFSSRVLEGARNAYLKTEYVLGSKRHGC